MRCDERKRDIEKVEFDDFKNLSERFKIKAFRLGIENFDKISTVYFLINYDCQKMTVMTMKILIE